MKNNNCFIVYSPLHAFVADIIIEYYSMKNVEVYLPHFIEYEFNPKIFVKRFHYAGTGVGKFRKLGYFILNYLTVSENNYKELFLPNDADPFVMLFEKKFTYERLNFMEEGVTAFSRLQYKKSSSTFRSTTNNLKALFGLDRHDVVLSSPKIERAFVFFVDILKEIRSDIEYVDLNRLINTVKVTANSLVDLSDEILNPDILIATSPFTENGHCENYEEVDVIANVIAKNKSKSILLKLHYRDDRSKYNEILTKYNNVKILPSKYNNIPYQIFHSILKPRSIYAFHSSILFSVPALTKDFKRVSMLKLIDTPRANAFYDGLISISALFDDMYFYNVNGELTES
jgi:hypothetical protein